MFRLIQWLIFGHVHKWIDVDRTTWEKADSSARGPMYICKCEGCGKYKAFKI